VWLAAVLASMAAGTAQAQPPANFAVEDVATGLEQPIGIRFLPDGRMLLLHKKGPVRILDVLASPVQSAEYMDLASPAHAAGLNSGQERGVLDVAIDPNFPAEPYIYLL
jgi:glucose/arabinose dehydrogenase